MRVLYIDIDTLRPDHLGYNGFREMYNTGKSGGERSDEIVPVALDWLDRRGKEDHWYLHVNLWDPHTPYKVPTEEGNPFENDPPPSWMTEEIRQNTWDTYGPGCAREPGGAYTKDGAYAKYPRMPRQVDSMDAYEQWIDGYDCGIRYADRHVGAVLDKLESLEVLDDTMVIVSSDHGENLGELAVYGDHQTADHVTNRVPLIIRHPEGLGGKGRVDRGLHYQFDFAATVVEMFGGEVPASWDAQSFLETFQKQIESGRRSLVVSNCAWACQRSARWDDYILIRSYHTGFKNYPEIMLFNVKEDPRQFDDLTERRPDLVDAGLAIIERWTFEEMRRSSRDVDPMWTVMREGGPFHARFGTPSYDHYLERLRNTGRARFAEKLAEREKMLQYVNFLGGGF